MLFRSERVLNDVLENRLANRAIRYQTGLSFTPQGQLTGVGGGATLGSLSGLLPLLIIGVVAIIAVSLVFKAIR